MGKSTISMAIFNSELLVYQRVYTNYWLVVEPTPLKNDGVRQMGWSFPYMENSFFSKPPTRWDIYQLLSMYVSGISIIPISWYYHLGGMIADMILASWDMLSDCFYVYKWDT